MQQTKNRPFERFFLLAGAVRQSTNFEHKKCRTANKIQKIFNTE